ncbi:hypothetical protein F0562_010475 [Nyssa sinensis]|uniref:Uncharacterized protein n=1 Tax=Nyssa sinensis TaxID=561372 RepID=A0A5J5A1N2_9ASTE|nr:hypothetical protein F0562_010475 [Nyssa sinensis]
MSCRMLFTIALCLFIPWIFLEKPKMDAEAIAGVGAYNNHKLKKEASRGTSNESQHSESVPLVSSSTSEKYIN